MPAAFCVTALGTKVADHAELHRLHWKFALPILVPVFVLVSIMFFSR